MAIETYTELAEQMRADAHDFATTMRAKENIGEYVVKETYGHSEPSNFGRILGIWVVRTATRYDGTPLQGRCNILFARAEGYSRFAEGRHLGLSLETTLSMIANDNREEPQEIVIRADDGDFGILTHHTHGNTQLRRRVSTAPLHPSSYLGAEAHYAHPTTVQDTYEAWRADLDALRS